jgi:starch synthase
VWQCPATDGFVGRIRPEQFNLTRALDTFPVPMDNHTEPAELMQTTLDDNVPVYMIDSVRYFDRDGIYMYPDDAERFIFFCRGVLEAVKRLGWQPDIIHCHDWHTALVPNWLKTIYARDPFFAGALHHSQPCLPGCLRVPGAGNRWD